MGQELGGNMMQPNKYGGVQAARFGNAGVPMNAANSAQQQLLLEQMQMDMEMGDDSAYDDEYGDYDDEMDNMVASGDTEGGGALYQYGGQQVYVNAQGVPVGVSGLESSSGDALMAEGYEFLEEELDENYEPTADEIEEYAKYLGMDL